jgi:hypothetical protein
VRHIPLNRDVGDPHVDRLELVRNGGSVMTLIVAYHGSRLTAQEIVDVRRDGLRVLKATDREQCLRTILSAHPRCSCRDRLVHELASAIILPRPGARRQNKLNRDGRRQSIFLLRDASLGVDSAHYGPLLMQNAALFDDARALRRVILLITDKLRPLPV